MLRKALADGVESGESSFEDIVKLVAEKSTCRFEHYELVTGEDGKPVELGGVRWESPTRRSTSICTAP